MEDPVIKSVCLSMIQDYDSSLLLFYYRYLRKALPRPHPLRLKAAAKPHAAIEALLA